MNAKFYELFFAIFLMVSGYGLMAYIIVRFFINKARLERSREEIVGRITRPRSQSIHPGEILRV